MRGGGATPLLGTTAPPACRRTDASPATPVGGEEAAPPGHGASCLCRADSRRCIILGRSDRARTQASSVRPGCWLDPPPSAWWLLYLPGRAGASSASWKIPRCSMNIDYGTRSPRAGGAAARARGPRPRTCVSVCEKRRPRGAKAWPDGKSDVRARAHWWYDAHGRAAQHAVSSAGLQFQDRKVRGNGRRGKRCWLRWHSCWQHEPPRAAPAWARSRAPRRPARVGALGRRGVPRPWAPTTRPYLASATSRRTYLARRAGPSPGRTPPPSRSLASATA